MRKRFAVRKLFQLMCVGGGILGLSSNAMASAFQLFEQDGASVGNYHAGRSAELNDASAVFYNPAGITRIHNQQIVIGDVGILSDVKYRGTTNVSLALPAYPPFGIPASVTTVVPTTSSVAQGGAFSQVPNLYYVAPIRDYIGVGLGINVPFGLRTEYGRNTAVRYTATKSQIEVIDITPSIGFNLTKQFSLGVGFDIQKMSAELDTMVNAGPASLSYETNRGWSTGYGYHAGALFQYTPNGRIGLAYNSQVIHHVRGTSRFVGPIANAANGVPLTQPSTIYSGNANVHLTLPAYTTLSGFQQVTDKWALMGTVMYTQWSVIQNLTLQGLSGVQVSPLGLKTPATNGVVNLPTHYRNTWNVSAGANYQASDKIMVRTGIGWDQTPISNTYRELRVPDENRIAVALGGHYQHNKALGFDLGWTHLFMAGRANVNPPALQIGQESIVNNGTVQGSADVFGGQFTWTIA